MVLSIDLDKFLWVLAPSAGIKKYLSTNQVQDPLSSRSNPALLIVVAAKSQDYNTAPQRLSLRWSASMH